MHILYPFAKRFIAGEDLQSVLKSIDHLYNPGFLSTVDVLGENVYRVDQALRAKLAYLDLLDHVAGLARASTDRAWGSTQTRVERLQIR